MVKNNKITGGKKKTLSLLLNLPVKMLSYEDNSWCYGSYAVTKKGDTDNMLRWQKEKIRL